MIPIDKTAEEYISTAGDVVKFAGWFGIDEMNAYLAMKAEAKKTGRKMGLTLTTLEGTKVVPVERKIMGEVREDLVRIIDRMDAATAETEGEKSEKTFAEQTGEVLNGINKESGGRLNENNKTE